MNTFFRISKIDNNNKKTVLIVDDSKLILNILEKEIKDALDVRILKAINYKDAVKYIINEEIIHVAILDLNLPDAPNGEIVDFALGKNIPSAVITGSLNQNTKKALLKKDILDYIIKDSSASIQSVINTIDRTLKNYDTNVMIVEDSPVQLIVAQRQLENMKLNVTTAMNGEQALELINKGDIKYSLILTDYNMPVMDGLELTYKLRENFKKNQLGILVLSANTDPDLATDFLNVGANDFITKPYTQIEFKTRINANLELIDLFKEMDKSKVEIQKAHKNIKDSINYASIIQQAILSDDEILNTYSKENFIWWKPKDTVGGDIVFISELPFKYEILVMVIDGAGHGVPGAFVTMLVKAIERQIVMEISYGKLKPSPAKILKYFNNAIKLMLKQDKSFKQEGDDFQLSNSGFDGGVLYYNKKTNECTYAGAKTPLYIINDNKMEIIKSDRKNVGYTRTRFDQEYTEYNIDIKANTKLYISSDGIIDQEGEDESRYGKNALENLLLKYNNEPFSKQKEIIKNDFYNFQNEYKQSDDVTIIGIQFQ